MTTHTAPQTGSGPWTASPAAAPLPLWQVPTFIAGLLAFLTVAAVGAQRPSRAVREFDRDLTSLREALARPWEPAENSVDLAENLVGRAGVAPAKAAEANFLLGMVYVRLAEPAPPDRAKELRAKALEQLQKAEALGVSAGDLPRMRYYIGKLLYQSGGDRQRAIGYLSGAIGKGADDPAFGYEMLTVLYLHLEPPDFDGALNANQKQLDATASEEAAAPARLLRAEILFNKGLRREALRVLERIGPTAPLQVLFPARFLQARCCMEEELYNKAVPLWNELLTMPQLTPANRGHILFVLGVCYQKLDPPDDRGAAGAWQEALKAGGEDSQAASLSLAELHLAGATPVDAVEDFQRALDKVKSSGDYRNPLFGIARVCNLLERGCRVYRDARDFGRAQQLAELYKKLAQPGRAEERFAEISEAWAKDLQEQALRTGAAEAGRLEAQARVRFRQAGVAYEQAVIARSSAEQADLLWRSAACYSLARADAKALAVLTTFVRLPMAPERQAEGWFALGEAHRALQHAEEARQAYYKSIECPTSPVAGRARFQLAVAEIERKNFEQAEAILRQNLGAASSASQRVDHEKSVYLLGELLYQRGDWGQASLILKEAARQYAANAGVLTARAHLGACYLKLAQEAGDKLKNPDGFAGAQVHLGHRRQEWLALALDVYQKLADQLDATSSKSPGQGEIALLRQASFAVADCRYDLGELVEALRLYKRLFQRYAHQAESLQALLRMSRCYHALTEPEKSAAREEYRVAVRIALDDLPRLPEEAFDSRQQTGRRDYWQRWLNQEQANLANPPRPPGSPSGGPR
jgi:tetratricopeptide (TPR) repeat protein